MEREVSITEEGRSGDVVYVEGKRTIKGWWEFASGDAIAIVNMGSATEWTQGHPWAVERRAAILRYVADEVIRQKARGAKAEIDEDRGDILLRRGAASVASPAPASTHRNRDAIFVKRHSNLKAMVGITVLVIAIVIGGVIWFGKQTFMVAPKSGVPLNECVRSENHIATLIQTTDPHLPEISGRGGNTTTSISILIIPLDGTDPQVVPVVGELEGGSYSLARIMGSDGRTLWFDAAGLYGVRLSDYELITPDDLRKANPAVSVSWWADASGMDIVDGKLHIVNNDHSAAVDVDPHSWRATPATPKVNTARFERREPSDQLASGFITSTGRWFGVHAQGELDGDFKVKKWIRPVESAEDAKRQRRFYKAELEPSSEGGHFRILSVVPVGTTEYLNAAFLRMDARSEPLRLYGAESVLMIHTDKPGLGGKLIVSRVDVLGNVLWSSETGLDRYYMSQILPGTEVFAFIGTRPPVEGKLSEPLVVLVDNTSGRVTSHSLWR